MKMIDHILDRRSIRRFTEQKIDDETIKTILTAAMYAPSAVNLQPWHFVVIDQWSMMERIMEIHPHARMLRTASHAVVVCGDLQLQHDDGYWVVDCGAATQNLLLAAHTLGLGSCWVGIHPREERKTAFSRLLSLPSHVLPNSPDNALGQGLRNQGVRRCRLIISGLLWNGENHNSP